MKRILFLVKTSWIPATLFILFLLILSIFPFEYKALKIKSFSSFFVDQKRIYFYLTDLLIVLFILLGLFRGKGKPFSHSVSYFFLGLLAAVLFSTTINLGTYPLFPTREIISLCLAFCFFWKILYHVDDQKKKTWTHLFFFAMFLIALFESLFAFYQYFSQIPLWIRNISHHHPEELLQIPGFFVEGGRKWIFDRFFIFSQKPEYIIRASGTFGHPNALGGFFLLSLPITFYLFYQTFSTKMRVLFGLGIFFQTIALTLTFSRAAIFSWIVIAFFWLFMMIRKKTIDHHLPLTFWNLRNAFFHSSMKKLTLVLGISLLCSTFFFYEQHLSRGGILNYNELARDSDRGRKEDIKAAIQIIKDHPFFGVGYGNFPHVRNELSPPDTIKRTTPVHSVTLLLLSETGIIGFLFFAGVILSLLLGAISHLTSPLVITLLSVLIGFGMVGQVDFYLWFSHNGRLFFFLSLAFLAIQQRPFSLYAFFLHKIGRKISSTV